MYKIDFNFVFVFGEIRGEICCATIQRDVVATTGNEKALLQQVSPAIFNHLILITDVWIATQAEIRRQA